MLDLLTPSQTHVHLYVSLPVHHDASLSFFSLHVCCSLCISFGKRDTKLCVEYHLKKRAQNNSGWQPLANTILNVHIETTTKDIYHTKVLCTMVCHLGSRRPVKPGLLR